MEQSGGERQSEPFNLTEYLLGRKLSDAELDKVHYSYEVESLEGIADKLVEVERRGYTVAEAVLFGQRMMIITGENLTFITLHERPPGPGL